MFCPQGRYNFGKKMDYNFGKKYGLEFQLFAEAGFKTS